ncbi:MAG TPA: universal stress protein [Xanthomarina sp.]|nr:universal stress protein [Xanthomarina sp.]
MKKILLPTDFSANSWEAIRFALNLFKDEPCTFYIMHSLEPLVSAPSSVSSRRANEAIIESRKNESKIDLDKTLKKIQELPTNSNHSFETLIVHDYFLDAVTSTVDKLDIHIVILGTKGASGIKEMTIGSNTANLINKQSCPIIAVPQHVLNKMNLSEIGFATDLSIENYGDELDLLKEIALAHDSIISAVHIMDKSTEITPDMTSNKLALEMTLKPLRVDFYYITDVSVELGVRVFSESRKLGMLCIINKKRSFFEKLFNKSNSKSISSHLHVPLIIFNHKPV